MSAVISGAVPAEAAERMREEGTVDPTSKLAEALDEVVSDVLSGQVVRGFGRHRADIQSLVAALVNEDEVYDAFCRFMTCHDDALIDLRSAVKDQIEATLRTQLAGGTLVQDVAARMVEGERE